MKTLSTASSFLSNPAAAVLGGPRPAALLLKLATAAALLAAPGCAELSVTDDAGMTQGETGDFDDDGATDGHDTQGNEGGDAGSTSSSDSDSGSGSSSGDGDGDSGSDSGDSSDPFDRYIAHTVTGDGMVVNLLPGPGLSAVLPEVAEVAIFIPSDPSARVVASAADLDGIERFKVSAIDGADVAGNGVAGTRVDIGDYRVVPKPPTNCTFPPCPGEIPETGYVASYTHDNVRWTMGSIGDQMFGHGLTEVDGETVAVPFAGGEALRDEAQVQLIIAQTLLEDAGGLFEAPLGSLPPEVRDWPSWCDAGKSLIKGVITFGQAACCMETAGTACAVCAVAGEGGKDGVDSIDCD